VDATCFTMLENTPVGPLRLAGDAQGLRMVWFLRGRRARKPDPSWKEDRVFFARTIRQLQSYFAGELKQFDVSLALDGTEFQKKVWNALRTIPYGATISYGELAKKIGEPKSARAVGLANGQNPTPIIVPCHRVIGSDGSLTGFGGGIENKRRLLELESGQRRLL